MQKKLLKFLRSMTFGMILLGLILLCSFPGSVIAQGNQPDWYVQTYPDWHGVILALGLDDVFGSWYFIVLLALLCLNLTLCSLVRVRNVAKASKNAASAAAARKTKVFLNPEGITQLRQLLAFRCADPFLPEGVAAYIAEHGLYNRNYKNLSMEELEEAVISFLNPNRVKHTLGCRDTAAELAKLWGADETDAARAGMLHDVTKALDGQLQLTLCREYGVELDEFSNKNPKTLHALTGSLVAERIFGENKAVVDAIASHTTGKAGMNTLEKIIYVADYMEPCRDFPGVEELRHLAHTDITAALKLGLEMTLAVLHSQGREISPGSSQALEYLQSVKGR